MKLDLVVEQASHLPGLDVPSFSPSFRARAGAGGGVLHVPLDLMPCDGDAYKLGRMDNASSHFACRMI